MAEDDHVYIGRDMQVYVAGAVGSKWANPFKVKSSSRTGCTDQYRDYVLASPELMGRLGELKGKVLGCWCAPERCHGHVLAELVDGGKVEE